MDIKKLTITPIIRGTKGIVIDNPITERAQTLIKERLSSNYECTKSVKPRLPKFLRGFVNPKTRVVENFRNYI